VCTHTPEVAAPRGRDARLGCRDVRPQFVGVLRGLPPPLSLEGFSFAACDNGRTPENHEADQDQVPACVIGPEPRRETRGGRGAEVCIAHIYIYIYT